MTEGVNCKSSLEEASLEEASVFRTKLTICNRRGLHARAAAKFVRLAGNFDAEISVCRKDICVSGVSIMGLMMLAASPGSSIEVSAVGRQAGDAVRALEELVSAKFEED